MMSRRSLCGEGVLCCSCIPSAAFIGGIALLTAWLQFIEREPEMKDTYWPKSANTAEESRVGENPAMNAEPKNHDPEILRNLLRHWRGVRSSSQLDLALRTGVSQRHISFIESGRVVPSRETLLKLAGSLDVPFRDRNALLIAAGYAPKFSEEPWDSQVMQAINTAVKRMLRQHEPYPAIVMDRHWNVLMTNESAPRFFGRFIDLSRLPKPRNLLRLMLGAGGMKPFISNWDDVVASLLERIYRESLGRQIDSETRELLSELGTSAEAETASSGDSPSRPGPVVPISFHLNGRDLNYFSLVATVGTPQTIAAQELRIECMFPADEATEDQHLALLGGDTRDPVS